MSNRKPIIKVIPDSLFHQLWNSAIQIHSLDEYIQTYTFSTSKDKIDFTKYDIDDLSAYELLKTIWNAARLSFKDILQKSGMKKAEFSHFFCIPIRTLEDWYAGKSQCPTYMRLMFIRYFHIPYLPPRVTLLTIHQNKKTTQSPRGNKKSEKSLVSSKSSKSVLDIDNDDDFLQYLDSAISKVKSSVSEFSSAKQILSKTDYLDDIMKR